MKFNILRTAIALITSSQFASATWCSLHGLGSTDDNYELLNGFCLYVNTIDGPEVFKCWNPDPRPCCDVGDQEVEFRRRVDRGYVICRKGMEVENELGEWVPIGHE
ncbi:hypothetical protein B0J13DRAFT_678712 [Dactylonectria estremocensis]|uniref:Uncharacterized protein n=1 Tax=Dactylonectria estremocensis TaxID=1079267 RepID=A0A9P9E3G8_9HYPO|nr:hypothetical protein B0J13DRAFT_678712 [Dactylonectria estremocensis]